MEPNVGPRVESSLARDQRRYVDLDCGHGTAANPSVTLPLPKIQTARGRLAELVVRRFG